MKMIDVQLEKYETAELKKKALEQVEKDFPNVSEKDRHKILLGYQYYFEEGVKTGLTEALPDVLEKLLPQFKMGSKRVEVDKSKVN